MTTQAKAKFQVAGWDEKTYEGAIKGTSSIEYLMSYAVDGKSGTFVIQHVGSYSDGAARSTWSVLPGAGTGDLVSLCDERSYGAGHGVTGEVSFSYNFEPNS